MQAQLAKSTSVHAVLLCLAACLQGFTFLDPQSVDANLALSAHYKMFLHAALLAAIAAAAVSGAFPKMGYNSAMGVFILTTGGAWLSTYADIAASFIKIALPMSGAKACRGFTKNCPVTIDGDHFNSQLIAISAFMILFGLILAMARTDPSSLMLSTKAKKR